MHNGTDKMGGSRHTSIISQWRRRTATAHRHTKCQK